MLCQLSYAEGERCVTRLELDYMKLLSKFGSTRIQHFDISRKQLTGMSLTVAGSEVMWYEYGDDVFVWEGGRGQ